MIVDLNKLEFRQAFALIRWCVANRIDYDRATALMFAWYADPLTKADVEWKLEVPDKHMTLWFLRWA